MGARWAIHGITCEPAGKDHGAAGGSYDTGIPICRLLGGDPPDKIVYEWIQLREWAHVKLLWPNDWTHGSPSLVPPEILRYVIARSKINRHIELIPGVRFSRLLTSTRDWFPTPFGMGKK
ncbi:MAG: hypothetical protein Ct9H90mP24_4140 [Methanobacteriota archaeon]|nr:MAG: hypothetical protein Ct9H90mP24_4140 [Euryarchaeota archaeon]